MVTVSTGVADNLGAVENAEDQDDIFFTEEVYEMFSLSRTHNIRVFRQEKAKAVKPLREWKDAKRKEKQQNTQKSQKPTPSQDGSSKTAKQAPRPPKVNRLACPNPSFSYPTFSRLTLTQHWTFLELQAKYGSKGVRVTTSRESAEHQQWRQLGAMIYQDQQDFNAFAERVANNSPENYLNVPSAAVKFIQDALKSNLQRVEALPRHYTVLQSFTLNPGVPLPSDSVLQRIGSPVFLGKVPELHIPGLEGRKAFLTRSVPEGGDTSPAKQSDYDLQKENVQKLAEAHKADIIISTSSLRTFLDNHAPLYEHPWEIPIEVKAGDADTSSNSLAKQKVVHVQKPLRKHMYYPYEASALYHKFILKMMLSCESDSKYGKIEEKMEEDLAIVNAGRTVEKGAMLGDDDFGAASILDLETFGSSLPVDSQKAEDVESEVREEVESKTREQVESETRGEGGSDACKPTNEADGKSSLLPDADTGLASGDVKDVAPDQADASEQMDAATEEVLLPESALSVEKSRGTVNSLAEDTNKDENISNRCEQGGKVDDKPNSEKTSKRDIDDGDDVSVNLTKSKEKSGVMALKKKQNIASKEIKISPAKETSMTVGNVRKRVFSESSSDDEKRLMIVSDSEKQADGSEHGKRRSSNQRRVKNLDVVVENDDGVGDVPGDLSKDAATKVSDVGEAKDEETATMEMKDGETSEVKVKDEATAGQVVTRRSARLRKQASENDATDASGGTTGYRRKLRRRGHSKDESGDDDDASVTQKSSSQTGMRLRKRHKDNEEKDVDGREDYSPDDKEETKESSGDATQEIASGEQVPSEEGNKPQRKSKLVRVKSNENKDRSIKDEVDDSNDDKKASVTDDTGAKREMKTEKLATPAVVSPGKGSKKKGDTADDHQRPTLRKRKSFPQAAGDKTDPAAKKTLGSRKVGGGTSKTESTIDEIMRLQEKMLNRRKTTTISPPRGAGGAQGDDQGQQGGAHLPGEGEHTSASASFGGVDLQQPSEGNYTYSLWRFGRLRMLIRTKCHGILKEGQGTDQRDQMVSIVSKLEHQADFGLEMLSASELTRVWLHMYLRPGSKVIRGRIDAQTSEILSWEYLDSASLIQSQQAFQPAMCLKMLHHILGKLVGLSPGKYLLKHRSGDAHVSIHQCMEQTARNIRASYDLHAAHQASTLLTSLPPTIPWVPLDPNAPYPRERWNGCVPLTFPPCPPNYKHPSTQQGGKYRKKKKKKGKGSAGS